MTTKREELLEDDVRTLQERVRELEDDLRRTKLDAYQTAQRVAAVTLERDAARDQAEALEAGLTEARSLLEEQARVHEAAMGELAARLEPADPAKVELLRAFVLASSRAAWKLATAYVRREVSPRAEYESLFRAAGLRVGFDGIDTDAELKVIELLRDLKLTGGGHG